jgi:hypothetical protein
MRDAIAKLILTKEAKLAAGYVHLKRPGHAELGAQYLGQKATDLETLQQFVYKSILYSSEFFKLLRPAEYKFKQKELKFHSPLATGDVQNDLVIGDFYESRDRQRAVIVVGHWNAQRIQYRALAGTLARLGISCLVLSLPYHDERQTPGVNFAREIACENIGLTIRSHRQAVMDVRAGLDWLEGYGFHRLGIIGASLGSSIATITAAHDSRVRALALILMADDFAEVVWTGTATEHIRQSLESAGFSLQEVQQIWSVISPNTYVPLLANRLRTTLIFSGEYDRVFLPKLTERFVRRLELCGMKPSWEVMKCGHYTFSRFPFNVLCLMKILKFLRREL